MKKFILFSGSSYYADGGAFDIISDFDTMEECQVVWSYITDAITNAFEDYSWAHLLNTETKEIIILEMGGYCGRPKDWYNYEMND